MVRGAARAGRSLLPARNGGWSAAAFPGPSVWRRGPRIRPPGWRERLPAWHPPTGRQSASLRLAAADLLVAPRCEPLRRLLLRLLPSPNSLGCRIAVHHRHVDVHEDQIELFALLGRRPAPPGRWRRRAASPARRAENVRAAAGCLRYPRPPGFGSGSMRGEAGLRWRRSRTGPGSGGNRVHRLQRQAEVKRAPAALPADHADFASHQFHQIAADGESQPGAALAVTLDWAIGRNARRFCLDPPGGCPGRCRDTSKRSLSPALASLSTFTFTSTRPDAR